MTTMRTMTVAAPVAPTSGVLRPLGLDEVRITGGLWAERQRVNASATLPHIAHWLEREGWIRNFDLAASGALPEGRRGREFSDSEVYKYLESVAWELGREPDAVRESEFRSLVARIAAAQEPDGYLNTRFGRPGQRPRWSDLEWGHELYCLGHLFQAAVARERTRPGSDDGLLGIATRAADLVCEAFGPEGIASVCGHAEIEPALVELARVTGEPRYLDQARLFVERRGNGVLDDIEWGRAYFQDDVPIREATVLRGHAVRANYLAAGAVDVAVETGDAGLADALERQWDATVARRTYITGGQGSHHQDEAFGEDWMLPPDRAYSETCAGVASVMFSWRLLLAQGSPRFADLIERTLYNVVATSPSWDGSSFFYTNTLHRRHPGSAASADEPSPRAASSLRAPWFEVSCCPPNVARTLASLAGYLATASDEGLQLHQYAPSSIRTTVGDGRRVAVDVETEYPAEGRVRVVVRESPDGVWSLSLRVPAWADGATVTVRGVDGAVEEIPASTGSVVIARRFEVGDAVELTLPIEARVTRADPRIDAVRGCVAIERGPEVLCLESTDLPASALGFSELRLDLAEGVRTTRQGALARVREARAAPSPGWPYVRGDVELERPVEGPGAEVELRPYRDWANRGPSSMRVWIPLAGPEG